MWNISFSAYRRIAFSRRLIPRLLLPALPAIASTLASAAVASTTQLMLSPSAAGPPAMTLTAQVMPLTTGTVTFCDDAPAPPTCPDAAVVGKAQLTVSETGTPTGTATLTIIPATGNHSYYAIFSGTAAESGSKSNIVAMQVLYPTAMKLTAPPGSAGYNLTATVTGFSFPQPPMAGSVSFEDLTFHNLLGTAALPTPPLIAQSFLPPASVRTDPSPADAAVGDFNEDGKPDLAVVTVGGQDAVSILIGNGDGTFQAPMTLPLHATNPCASEYVTDNCSIAVGDFNDDGHADLAVTIGWDDSVTILLGHGDGTFSLPNKILTGGSFPEAVRVGDFDNDGILDLAIANAGDGTTPGSVSFLKGVGDGTFTPFAGSPLTVGVFPFFLAVGFFNADIFADVAVVNEGDNTVTILLGNGQGQFQAQQTIPVGIEPGPIVAAPFNGDTNVDLAVASFIYSEIDILEGNGQGQFSQLQPGVSVSANPRANPFGMVALDYNGDGYLDLAVSNYRALQPNGTLTLLKGGPGGFTLDKEIDLGSLLYGLLPNDVVSGDFNGDGEPDLAIPESGTSSTTTAILLNQNTQTATAVLQNVVLPGAGTHVVQAGYPAPPGNTGFGPSSATIDLQGLISSTTLTLSATPSNPGQQLATMPVTFTAQLSPTASVAPTGTVSFLDAGTLLGTVAINAAGQATYSTSTLGDGAHSITASYSGDPIFPASTSSALAYTISDLQVARVGNNNTSIVPGTTVVYTLQVQPLVATTFLYSVSMTASGLPEGASATFSPATPLPAGGGTTKITMTVTTAAMVSNARPPSPFERLPLALGLLLPLLGVNAVRRRQIPRFLALALFAALSLTPLAGLNGCSDAGLFAARKASYSITVTATEGTLQRATSVPLGIQ